MTKVKVPYSIRLASRTPKALGKMGIAVSKPNKHVLIVEDSPDLQYLLGHLFQSEGYSLSQAYNGQEALDLLQSMPDLPSLILLDIMMPVMDGIEFRQKQIAIPKFAKIPVIVMTADTNPQLKSSTLAVANIIQKPIKDLDGLFQLAENLSGI
ncbi:MAG: response regulator [Bdellovibrionales bacterium]|nr:response regulator [Bdellovibrionales bacterium]